MQTHRLDAVDLRILTALQVKGRATNVEIAEFANLTPPPTLRRIKTLEDHGIIRGYHAVLDARKLGYEVLAFIQIQLGSHTREHLRAFETLMRDSANVRECYALSGQRDFSSNVCSTTCRTRSSLSPTSCCARTMF
ncbi:MAG: Lrp/AsnC family transcriptional regulator [Rhizomicrobium sp.]